VEALAQELNEGRLSLAHEMETRSWSMAFDHGRDHQCETCSTLQEQVTALSQEIEEQRRKYRQELAALRTTSDTEKARLRAELHALETEVVEFTSTVERALR